MIQEDVQEKRFPHSEDKWVPHIQVVQIFQQQHNLSSITRISFVINANHQGFRWRNKTLNYSGNMIHIRKLEVVTHKKLRNPKCFLFVNISCNIFSSWYFSLFIFASFLQTIMRQLLTDLFINFISCCTVSKTHINKFSDSLFIEWNQFQPIFIAQSIMFLISSLKTLNVFGAKV